MWRGLKVQTTNRANFAGQRMVVLNKINVDAVFDHALAVPAFAKKAAVVSKTSRGNQQNARQSSTFDSHDESHI
jgi:hypothetical protein